MKRTKVFYFIPHLKQGGSERQIVELIRKLPPRFEPVLCLYNDEIHYRDELPAGQPKHVLGVDRINPRAFLRLVEILRSERPAIVHSYRDKANFWARLAALLAGVPVIIASCRSRFLELRYLATERLLSDLTQLQIVNSRGTRDELVRWARVRPSRIRVLGNFLDIDYFRPPTAEERARARASQGLEPGQRLLLLPGRIGIQKHQLGLLRAFEILARRGSLPPGAVLFLAGRERDRRVSALVRRLADRPTLRGRVRYLGAQRDIRSLYWAADILVLPSLWEGLSNAALEGCACGLPTLLSRAANLDRIVVPDVTGLEIPTGHQTALRQALGDLFTMSGDRLAVMGRRAREHVTRRFSPVRIQEELVQIYDELLCRRGPLRVTKQPRPRAAPDERQPKQIRAPGGR